jgi:RNA polymerase-binding transcription factor DksA
MATIKNLVNFAAKFLEMAKAKGKEKKKVAAKTKSKPVAKKVSKPVKKTVKPVAKAKAKPAAKAKAKPVAKKVVAKKAKPVVKKKVVAKAKPVAVKKKAAVKAAPKAKPVAKIAKKVVKAAKPVKKEIAKPVAKPLAKAPVKIAVSKPIGKAVSKHAAKPAAFHPSSKPDAHTVAKPLYKTNQKIMEPEIKELNHRYSDEDLKEFRELIDKKLVSAREELKNLKENLDNHTESQAGNKAWNMEEGTDTSEMEYLMNQISRQHQYIRNLELALVRVENKTYGICRVTGRLIPKERLRIVPHATLSLEAKMTRKKEDSSPGAALSAPPSDFSEGFED